MGLKDILTMRFENESLKIQIIRASVVYILYFQQAFTSPNRLAEMHEERNLRIEDYMPKEEELREAA